ncbi:hydrolase 1, exosortase A system-associated [Pseudorhodoferax sp.]|uniref:hydrolase 1, exosortase A system-associated n=1 Tax=Pseudorhodoferax sp. TaxID=1993553 RepID=UPI0039E26F55
MSAPAGYGYHEQALSFACDDALLQGVLTLPPAGQPCAPVGVLIVVGGPQVRIGSHRQFVQLARHLAQAGHAVLRFDVRGMGDSTGVPRNFETLDADIAAAVDTLQRSAGVSRTALWGLCDGASASLLYLDSTADPRIAGLALINPWVRSEQSLARTHVKHYYRERLLQKDFWTKLLRGGVGLRALHELGTNTRRALRRAPPATPQRSFQQRMAAAWQRFDGGLLVVLSGNDWTAREFEEQWQQSPDWAAARRRGGEQWLRLAQADHTLSDPVAQRAVQVATAQWLQSLSTRH